MAHKLSDSSLVPKLPRQSLSAVHLFFACRPEPCCKLARQIQSSNLSELADRRAGSVMSLAPDALRDSATGRHRSPVSLDTALRRTLGTPYRQMRELRDAVLWAVVGAVFVVSCVLSLTRYIRVSPAT